jgi:hypothetical protein
MIHVCDVDWGAVTGVLWYVVDENLQPVQQPDGYLWKDLTWHAATFSGWRGPQCLGDAPGWFGSREDALAALDKLGLKPGENREPSTTVAM